MGDIIRLALSIVAVIAGFVFGRRAERAHFKSIREREASLQNLAVRSETELSFNVSESQLVFGNVVIANDRFKSLVGSFESFFGGRLKAFEPLIDRGRREAILRLKAQAADWGAKEVLHLRVESSMVDNYGVEVLAIGTAVK